MRNNDSRPAASSVREKDNYVKDLIEKCLQLYMNMEEVMIRLPKYYDIEPRLIRIVWKQLEKDNPRFFHDYYIRLELIKQITQFNRLLQQQQQYELMLSRTPISPLSGPSIAMQHGGNVLGCTHGEQCTPNATAVVASMGSPVQPHSLDSHNQREFPTHASLEQSMPSTCCLPFDSVGKYEQGADSWTFNMQTQGRLSLLNNPISSSSPDHGAFETEANELNSLGFLLDSPEHHGAGGAS